MSWAKRRPAPVVPGKLGTRSRARSTALYRAGAARRLATRGPKYRNSSIGWTYVPNGSPLELIVRSGASENKRSVLAPIPGGGRLPCALRGSTDFLYLPLCLICLSSCRYHPVLIGVRGEDRPRKRGGASRPEHSRAPRYRRDGVDAALQVKRRLIERDSKKPVVGEAAHFVGSEKRSGVLSIPHRTGTGSEGKKRVMPRATPRSSCLLAQATADVPGAQSPAREARALCRSWSGWSARRSCRSAPRAARGSGGPAKSRFPDRAPAR